MYKFSPYKTFVAPLALAAIFLAGCGGKVESATPPADGAAAAPARAASAPAVPVTTVRARQQDFAIVLQAIGTAVPISSVDVKAQVTSVVTRVHVAEGQFVRAGEP